VGIGRPLNDEAEDVLILQASRKDLLRDQAAFSLGRCNARIEMEGRLQGLIFNNALGYEIYY